jgi:hypothetical protein
LILLVDYVTFQNASFTLRHPLDRAIAETVAEPQNVRTGKPVAIRSHKARQGLERTIYKNDPALFTHEADPDRYFIKNRDKVYWHVLHCRIGSAVAPCNSCLMIVAICNGMFRIVSTVLRSGA